MAIEIWKCPKCKIEVEIDRAKKSKEIVHAITERNLVLTFPTHPDCQLAKAVGKMAFSKLEKKVRTVL